MNFKKESQLVLRLGSPWYAFVLSPMGRRLITYFYPLLLYNIHRQEYQWQDISNKTLFVITFDSSLINDNILSRTINRRNALSKFFVSHLFHGQPDSSNLRPYHQILIQGPNFYLMYTHDACVL
jgi:hypothetical protein